MAAKFLVLCVIASVVTQGLLSAIPGSRSVVDIILADEFIEFITNPLIGRAITIPKSHLDILESCHVTFPGGAMYEAFPTDNIPTGIGITFEKAVQPYTSCAIGFKGVDVSRSGTYELISVVNHTSYRSITRQRFHMTFRESSDW